MLNDHVFYAIGDFHIGHKNFDENLLRKTLDKIYYKRDGFLLGMGDYCEFINEKTYGYEEAILTVDEQIELFIELFKPFIKDNRIYGLLEGNHEDRYWSKTKGLKRLCKNVFNCAYFGRMALFTIGKYWIYAHHPKSSATTVAGRDRIFNKMKKIQDADLYLVGHFHSLFQDFSCTYESNQERSLKTKWFACTGSFLEYKKSYAELKLYEPCPMGCKEIILKDNEHKIYVRDFEL